MLRARMCVYVCLYFFFFFVAFEEFIFGYILMSMGVGKIALVPFNLVNRFDSDQCHAFSACFVICKSQFRWIFSSIAAITELFICFFILSTSLSLSVLFMCISCGAFYFHLSSLLSFGTSFSWDVFWFCRWNMYQIIIFCL